MMKFMFWCLEDIYVAPDKDLNYAINSEKKSH